MVKAGREHCWEGEGNKNSVMPDCVPGDSRVTNAHSYHLCSQGVYFVSGGDRP